jgi:hypothetical protein
MKKIFSVVLPFLLSFLLFEGVEHLLEYFFRFEFTSFGQLGKWGLIIFFGFKYHLFCCLIPGLFLIWRAKQNKYCGCHEEKCDEKNSKK